MNQRRADHRPAKLIGQLSKAAASIIKEGDAAETACGEGGFSHYPGMATISEEKQTFHQEAWGVAAAPVERAMVASPAALMPPRRISFKMVTKKMHKSSQKLL